jgi:hypothetical protein
MVTSSGSDGMTLPRGEGESIAGKALRPEIRNEPNKKKRGRQGKKEARRTPSTSQITLDSGSILATMQDRVCELGLSFPTLDPTFPEVMMPGS